MGVSDIDERFMQRAFELAKKGFLNVAPNPMVGCVITVDDKIIGEGYHQEYGKAHAEPNAIQSVQDKSLLGKSTIYVTLEPCAHYGNTPPCVDLILSVKPKKVVIANVDPNPLVAGKSVKKIADAGIEMKTGVLKEQGERLNKRFFTYMQKKRPFIILKWAQTQDGFIARKNFDSKWISNEHSRKLVHQWRSEEQAIMVGTNTAIYDNPRLDVRMVDGKNPIRILVDKKLVVPSTHYLFDQSEKTIVYNFLKNEKSNNVEFVKLSESANLLSQIMADLFDRKISSLFVEGGAFLLQSFINEGLWDEARVFIGKQTFDDGISAPYFNKRSSSQREIEGDVLRKYYNEIEG